MNIKLIFFFFSSRLWKFYWFFFLILIPKNQAIFKWRQGILQKKKKVKQRFDTCKIDSQQSFLCVKHNNLYGKKHQPAVKQCWWLALAVVGHLLSHSHECCRRLTGILNLITPISNKIERKKGERNNKNILENHKWNK